MRISREPSPLQVMIDQKQLENVEYLNCLGSMITGDARCMCKIKSRVIMAKAAFNREKTLFTTKSDLNLWKKLVKCYIWSITLYDAETWTLQKVDQKNLESFELWCWRRMGKISWTDQARNEEVLHRVKGERSIIYIIKRRKAIWIGHALHRSCLLKHTILRKERWRDRSDGKKTKKMYAADGWPSGNEKILEIETRSIRSTSVECLLLKRLLIYHKTHCRMNDCMYSG
jgi:hypothetical protein